MSFLKFPRMNALYQSNYTAITYGYYSECPPLTGIHVKQFGRKVEKNKL